MANAFQAHAFQGLNNYTAAFQVGVEERVTTDSGSGSSAIAVNGLGGTNEAQGQAFTTVGAFTATGVAWKIFKGSSPADNIVFDLVDSNITSGTVLASVTMAASTIPTDAVGLYCGFYFDTPVALAAATQYWIRATRTGARDTINSLRPYFWTTATYSGGEGWTEASGVWASQTRDAQMSVFGDPITVTEPPILVMAPRR